MLALVVDPVVVVDVMAVVNVVVVVDHGGGHQQ